MRTAFKFHPLVISLVCLPLALAQPLAKPLADFDQMVSELKTGNAVGQPIRMGNTTIVPFASVQYGLGSADAAIACAGGLGAKTIPLGVVIVEGDDVRVELLPYHEEKPAATMQQLIQGVIDKKLSFMVNGINLGNASGNVADLVPMVNAMMGERTVLVNGLNMGNLRPPANEPASAETWYKLGEALRQTGQPAKAAEAYRNALRLRPHYPDAARALAELKQ